MTGAYHERHDSAGKYGEDSAPERSHRAQPRSDGTEQLHVAGTHASKEKHRQKERDPNGPASQAEAKACRATSPTVVAQRHKRAPQRQYVGDSARTKVNGGADPNQAERDVPCDFRGAVYAGLLAPRS